MSNGRRIPLVPARDRGGSQADNVGVLGDVHDASGRTRPYATDLFVAYTSGTFNEHDTSHQINHGVTLVGWDDATNAWIIKNSWGTGWGMSGFMYIAYDSNNIGYGAAWVEVKNVRYSIPTLPFQKLMPSAKPFGKR